MTHQSKSSVKKPNRAAASKRLANKQATSAKATTPSPSKGLHPRNLHNNGYDFDSLIACLPALKSFVKPNPYGNLSIDFANPNAVKALNNALLKHHYGVEQWDIPAGFLCPPIPGRADYIHYIADLLAVKKTNKKRVPKGPRVRALDIGTGANVIYPLIGINTYGWQFVASDIAPISIANAERILAANTSISDRFSARLQTNAKQIFAGIINQDERFDVTLCNPPFHSSLAEASAGTSRKLQNLAANQRARGTAKVLSQEPAKSAADTVLNFGGQKAELWCDGGEQAFLTLMINESQQFASQCLWFTSLVSKKENLKPAKALLSQVKAKQVREIEMHQGNKITRILAWTFLTEEQQLLWQQYRDANC